MAPQTLSTEAIAEMWLMLIWLRWLLKGHEYCFCNIRRKCLDARVPEEYFRGLNSWIQKMHSQNYLTANFSGVYPSPSTEIIMARRVCSCRLNNRNLGKLLFPLLPWTEYQEFLMSFWPREDMLTLWLQTTTVKEVHDLLQLPARQRNSSPEPSVPPPKRRLSMAIAIPSTSSSASSSGVSEVAERDEKLLQEKEKLLQEKNNILSFAKCPICVEYMVAPIFQCTVGHSVCTECKNKLVNCPLCKSSFTATRNFSLEEIIENMSFPCSNAEFGCKAMVLSNEKVKHGKCCEYRLYDCLPGREDECKWQGRRQDILTHMEQEHEELLWEGKRNVLRDPNGLYFDEDTLSCDLISAHGEIFWLQRHMDSKEKTYYISVHYIGPRENCKNYLYTLNFISGRDSHQKIKFRMRTHPDDVEIKDLKETGCFTIKKCMTEYFKSISGLVYTVEITETE